MRFVQKFVFFVFLVFGSVSQAEVYDVSTTAELREALASAAEAGGDNTIRLAAGTYSTQDDGEGTLKYISDQSGTLRLEGDSALDTNLDGSYVDPVLIFDGSGLEAIELARLSIQNGKCSSDSCGGLEKNNVNASGLHIDLYKVEVTITDVRILNNISDLEKPAVDCRCGAVEINNVEAFGNYNIGDRINRATFGGAFAIRSINNQLYSQITVSSSIFRDNFAKYGAALYVQGSLVIEDSTFERHDDFLGRMGTHETFGMVYGNYYAYCYDGQTSPCGIQNNVFLYNASACGSALFWTSQNRGMDFRGNLIQENKGQLSNALNNFTANILLANAFNEGCESIIDSAVINAGSGDLISNNLIGAQQRIYVEEGVTVNISNNVFTGSNEESFISNGAPFLYLYNNYLDPGNITLEPIALTSNIFNGVNLGFVNAEEGDYRLTSASDLIDAGTTDPELAYITDYDYTGTTARVIGASIDIGPYEYDGEAPPDSDGDGLNDNIDNCPSIANEDQADNDSDGEGDACDSDDDNDGTNDEDDAFPFDDSESLDTDGDGIGNNEDYDDDGDGFVDDSDPQPIIANVFAIDSDGDGVADSIDDYPSDATKQFGSDGDFDGDGFTNDEEVDYCTNPFDKNSQPNVGGLSAWMLYLGTQQQDTQ